VQPHRRAARGVTLSTETIVRDKGLRDPAEPGARQTQVQDLPADTLLFPMGSRYCETDLLSDIAWKVFAATPLGWGRGR
jgi:hypothetical protein